VAIETNDRAADGRGVLAQDGLKPRRSCDHAIAPARPCTDEVPMVEMVQVGSEPTINHCRGRVERVKTNETKQEKE
jgi:hypothetical protein